MFPYQLYNVLDVDTFLDLYDVFDPEGDNSNWKLTNRSNKNKSLREYTSWKSTDEQENHILSLKCASIINLKFSQFYSRTKGVRANFKLIRTFSNGQTHGQTTLFHTDFDTKDYYTSIMFLNPDWNQGWGGEFIVQDDKGKYHYFPIIPNSAIIIPSCWQHRGSPPNNLTDQLRMTLAFSFHNPNFPYDL